MKNELKFAFSLASKGQYTLYIALIEKFSYLILFVILARVSTTSGYGRITAIFAFSNILASLLNLGLGINLQKEISAGSKELIGIFYNTVFIKFSLFFVYAAGVFFYFYYQLQASLFLWMIPLAIYLATFQDVLNNAMYGFGKFRESFFALFTSRVFLLFLISLFFLIGLKSVHIIAGYLAGILFYQVVLSKGFIGASNFPFKVNLKFDKRLTKKIILNSIPMGVGVFAVLVYDKADVVIIQSFLGNKEVAFYAIAYSIYKLPSIVPGIFLVPLFSNIVSKYKSRGFVNAKRIVFIGVLMPLLALVLGIFVLALGEQLIFILFGSKFIHSAVYLNLLIFALPGLFLNNFSGTVLNALNLQKKQATGTIIGMIFNLALIFILIGRFGIWAAVVSTIISEYLVFLIQLYYILKNKQVFKGGHL